MKNNVWVCLEQNDGKIAGVSFEMLSEARKLADQLSGKVGAVLMGAGVKELAKRLPMARTRSMSATMSS